MWWVLMLSFTLSYDNGRGHQNEWAFGVCVCVFFIFSKQFELDCVSWVRAHRSDRCLFQIIDSIYIVRGQIAQSSIGFCCCLLFIFLLIYWLVSKSKQRSHTHNHSVTHTHTERSAGWRIYIYLFRKVICMQRAPNRRWAQCDICWRRVCLVFVHVGERASEKGRRQRGKANIANVSLWKWNEPESAQH